MDYSTALCDRNGEVIAQGLTLQCSSAPSPIHAPHGTACGERQARRCFPVQRSLRRGRTASARHLRHQAAASRRRDRGLGLHHGPSLRRRRHRAGLDRHARHRHLAGRAVHSRPQALRGGRAQRDADSTSSPRTRASRCRSWATCALSLRRCAAAERGFTDLLRKHGRASCAAISGDCRTRPSA